MDPEVSSRHATHIEEEESPLQQSERSPPPQGMADQYLGDSFSKAVDVTEEEIADEDVVEEDLSNDGGSDAKEPEQIPIKLLGSWAQCKVKDKNILALEKEGTVAARAESQWRTDFKVAVPAPHMTEILMLKSHLKRGLSMPPSHFSRNLLQFYGLQLHHTSHQIVWYP
jgi:hypothetical protein